jgi:hypothetical protein
MNESFNDLQTNEHLRLRWKLMVKRELEIVFIDKERKWYPLDEVDGKDLAIGLEKVSKEVAKRLQLLREQR